MKKQLINLHFHKLDHLCAIIPSESNLIHTGGQAGQYLINLTKVPFPYLSSVQQYYFQIR
jgi:hypothetical protein